MAFFGGLGDLLVTGAMGDWTAADEAHIAYGLSSWHPTAGTRAAGQVSRQRRGGRRVRYAGGRLEFRDDALPTLEWPFPAPLGTRTVIGEFTMADVVTIPSHLAVPEVRTYMTAEAASGPGGAGRRRHRPRSTSAAGPRRPSSSTSSCAPAARSAAPRRPGRTSTPSARRSRWRRSDRILAGRTRTTGVASAGEIFDAADFLRSLPDLRLLSPLPGGLRGSP